MRGAYFLCKGTCFWLFGVYMIYMCGWSIRSPHGHETVTAPPPGPTRSSLTRKRRHAALAASWISASGGNMAPAGQTWETKASGKGGHQQ